MTSANQSYLENAARFRQTAYVWRMLVVVVLAFLGQGIATFVVFLGYAMLAALLGGADFQVALGEIASLQTQAGLIALLVSFAGIVLGIRVGMAVLHRSGMRFLLGTTGRFGWRYFRRTAAVFLVIGGTLSAVSVQFGDVTPNLPPQVWAMWLAPALLAILLQTFAEEMLFRGYLQTLLAARFRSPLIWALVPALLFGALHLPNALPFGANAWLVLAAPTLIGLISAHLTVRTGGIAAAVGLHFANNSIGILGVSVPGPFSELGLYTQQLDLADIETLRPMILGNLAMILVTYLICLAVLPRRDA